MKKATQIPFHQILCTATCLILASIAMAQPGKILGYYKIDNNTPGFAGALNDVTFFGQSLSKIGDLDGDGISEIAISASGDDNRGRVFIIFPDKAGGVKKYTETTVNKNGLTGDVNSFDRYAHFGNTLVPIGDWNHDGIPDLLVTNYNDVSDKQFADFYYLFLSKDGQVASFKRMLPGRDFNLDVTQNNGFGYAAANLGDVDGDGIPDLAMGAPHDNDGGTDKGAIYVLFLKANGDIKAFQKISAVKGSFSGLGSNDSHFGISLCALKDTDAGSVNLYSGRYSAVNVSNGGFYKLQLTKTGTVKKYTDISLPNNIIKNAFTSQAGFGEYISMLPDINGDGQDEILVALAGDSINGKRDVGSTLILYPDSAGNISGYTKITSKMPGFPISLSPETRFGAAAHMGDLNGDGKQDIIISAPGDSLNTGKASAVYIFLLDGKVYNNINWGFYTNHMVKVFPNPSGTGALRVEAEHFSPGTSLKLMDQNGQTLLAQPVYNSQTIQTSQMAPGMYYLILENGSSSSSFPIIIQKSN